MSIEKIKRSISKPVVKEVFQTFGTIVAAPNVKSPKQPDKMWSEVREVTPQEFEEWFKHIPYDEQRHLRKWFVDDLVEKMETGEFRNTSTLVVAHCGTQAFMIDGQHRGRAVIKYGKPLVFNILHIRVNSYAEVQWNYGGIDIGQRRGLSDILGATGMVERTGLNILQQRSTLAGIPLIASGFESPYWPGGRPPSYDQRMRVLLDWADEAKVYFSSISEQGGLSQKVFRRSSVIAVALVTFRYKQKEAELFWSTVHRGAGLAENSPELSLYNFLANSTMNDKSKSANYCKRIASAWNGFMRGDRRVQLRGTIDNAPITILGTPYKRSRVLKDHSVLGSVGHVEGETE